MSNSISLIQAIILLNQEEWTTKRERHRSQKIDYFESTQRNMALAEQLTHQWLGRNLSPLPLKTKIVLLLIKEMADKACHEQPIRRFEYWFTRECIQQHTGWSMGQLKLHIARLEKMKYLHRKSDFYSLGVSCLKDKSALYRS